MPKLALLISFTPTTRLIVDVPEGKDVSEIENNPEMLDSIIAAAREKILRDAPNYLSGDNVTLFDEDHEVPYTDKDKVDLCLNESVCPFCGSKNIEHMGDNDYWDGKPWHCHECDGWFKEPKK